VNEKLLRAVQSQVFLHDWPVHPKVDGVVCPRCTCGKIIHTTTQWLEHLTNDVLPKIFAEFDHSDSTALDDHGPSSSSPPV
jgi:hypothetical protein